MRKFLLTLGSVAAVAAPLTTVIACGDDHAHEDDHHEDDHHDHEHVGSVAIVNGLEKIKETDLWDGTNTILTAAELDTFIDADHDLHDAFHHTTVELTVGTGTDGALVDGNTLVIEITPDHDYWFDGEYHDNAHIVATYTIGSTDLPTIVGEGENGDHDH